VEGPRSTEEFLGRVRGERLLVAEVGSPALSGPSDGASVVAIGPEGGFAPSEVSSFAEKSPVFFSLGPRILRLETAVVVALARLVDPA
jgi:16S rRNA (uracil1498-N3)-methyltransferase